jgi:hypothetical protein
MQRSIWINRVRTNSPRSVEVDDIENFLLMFSKNWTRLLSIILNRPGIVDLLVKKVNCHFLAVAT